MRRGHAGTGPGWASLRFADRAPHLTIADYVHSHDVLLARRDRIEAELEQLAASSLWSATIARLRCLRGIDTLSALGCAQRSVSGNASSIPTDWRAIWGLFPPRTSPAYSAARGSIT